MRVRIRLQAILIFFLGIVIITPNYAQKGYDWNNPLCIASDTGLGGPRYIETNLPLNEVAPAQTIEFRLRCKGDVPIFVQTQTGSGGVSIFASKIVNQYQPTFKVFDVETTVVALNSGETQKSSLYVFDIAASHLGEQLFLPALGEGQFHEFSVKINISERVVKPRVIPENPKPINPFYIPLFSVIDNSSDVQLEKRYAPYPLYLVSTFDTFPDPCVTPGPMVVVPPQVDFGTLNREDLVKSVKKSFFFRIGRSVDDTCNYNLYPIITFKATDPVVNDEIEISNGTNLSFVVEDLSSGSTIGTKKLQFNTPLRFGELKPQGLLNLYITANLRKNPEKPLRGGYFSTVMIYHIEFR
ncbi:hypothetical protein B9T19_03010 [Ignatzschineria sp. F8392]|uniref:hypothetical protein n=1 Tax=Ignatzschineria sp. F8392 TaxID=1980117 RepID=UPI000B99512B|nr:hypothetical protein [Ignatzschineria sp. F8392]OYQ81651.1 hypothetical protein B9T19_03010 [Ignatzschineria sp. F8392]